MLNKRYQSFEKKHVKDIKIFVNKKKRKDKKGTRQI